MIVIKLTSHGFVLSIDPTVRYINQNTVLDDFNQWMNSGRRAADFFQRFNSENAETKSNYERRRVMTLHTFKVLQTDGMVADSPFDINFTMKDGTTVSVGQYYEQKHLVRLVNKQPTLFVTRNGRREYFPA
jgi:hypothetical protein